jgi:hypothetical protein
VAGLVIADGLVTFLEGLPAMATAGAKVYPWARAPRMTASRPYCLLHQVSGGKIRSLTSPSGAARPTGVSHPRFQLDVFGRDYKAVRDLAAAVVTGLDGFSGTMADRTVQVVVVNDEGDFVDENPDDAKPLHGTELAEHRYVIDFTIWFVEGD